jgi:hypothetical protein
MKRTWKLLLRTGFKVHSTQFAVHRKNAQKAHKGQVGQKGQFYIDERTKVR